MPTAVFSYGLKSCPRSYQIFSHSYATFGKRADRFAVSLHAHLSCVASIQLPIYSGSGACAIQVLRNFVLPVRACCFTSPLTFWI